MTRCGIVERHVGGVSDGLAVGVAFILLVLPTSLFFWIRLARPNGFRVRRDEPLARREVSG